MASNPDFIAQLGQRYTAFEDALDAANAATDTEPAGTPSRTRQLWHTPSELFSPHYGYAVARYLASNYLLTWYPYHDLVIYELGGGRGTLMKNVLDYLRAADPAVYARTRARIVEVSPQLAKIQRRTLAEAGHGKDTVEIVPKSILDWDTPVPEPCFIVAMEVFDNLAHDCVRYDLTGSSRHSDNDDSNSGRRQRRLVGGGASSQGHGDPQPLQCVVLIDSRGDFYEFYTPHLDPVLSRFLRVRHAATGGHYPVPFATGRLERLWEKCRLWLFPFAPNLSRPEYVPTRLMQLFDVLDRYFPQHKLLAADFHELPNAIEGLNAPVVQTRFDRRTVPVSTPLVRNGSETQIYPRGSQY